MNTIIFILPQVKIPKESQFLGHSKRVSLSGGTKTKGRGYTEREREFRTRLCSQVGSSRSGQTFVAG